MTALPLRLPILVIIWVNGPLWFGDTRLVELGQDHGDGLFQLRVVAAAPGRRVRLHLDVGSYAVVLHLPLAGWKPDRQVN